MEEALGKTTNVGDGQEVRNAPANPDNPHEASLTNAEGVMRSKIQGGCPPLPCVNNVPARLATLPNACTGLLGLFSCGTVACLGEEYARFVRCAGLGSNLK